MLISNNQKSSKGQTIHNWIGKVTGEDTKHGQQSKTHPLILLIAVLLEDQGFIRQKVPAKLILISTT